MIRTAILTAVAALAITAPAHAGSVRVALAGKSPAQVEAEVTKAAQDRLLPRNPQRNPGSRGLYALREGDH